jgi:hypothetical protein
MGHAYALVESPPPPHEQENFFPASASAIVAGAIKLLEQPTASSMVPLPPSIAGHTSTDWQMSHWVPFHPGQHWGPVLYHSLNGDAAWLESVPVLPLHWHVEQLDNDVNSMLSCV